MKLIKLKLKNFRSHRDREFHFQEGVTAIVGMNGQGKSTVVEAIQFLFTGVLDGTKESVITVGESTGYISGEFEHEGKVGYLERHLDVTKAILRYDGKELKKAGEIKELWEKLLQINPEIFNQIIIAKQGDIPLLFTGNPEIRAKIFQKIFLVPNTSKLRDIIWDGYIKQLPPPYPIDDLVKIEEDIKLKNDELLIKSSELIEYEHITLEKYQEKENLVRELNEAIKNRLKQAELKQDGFNLLSALEEIKGSKILLAEEIEKAPFKLDYLKKALIEFDQRKYQVETKNRLTKQLEAINEAIQAISITDINKECEELDARYKAAVLQVDLAKNSKDELNQKLLKYGNFKGKTCCPTCGQNIDDITFLIKGLTDELSIKLREYDHYNSIVQQIMPRLSVLNKSKQEYDKLVNELNSLSNEINLYVNISYDGEEHILYKQVHDKINKDSDNLKELIHKEELQIQKIDNNNKLIESLNTEWTKDHLLQNKLENELREINDLKINLNKKQEISTQISVINAEINNLKNRIAASKINKEKNDKRDEFEKILLALYDVFHPNQFSKKVIQRYSHVVTDYLLENLAKFNLPYTASVNDNFGIDVMNQEGLLLPKVSGGQQMIIGLCLRLALLQLFAQNFSFMIIDEGSTGLHKVNQDIYFQMIKDFPRNQFKQVIIIDHNEKLAEVTDHVINLDVK